MKGEKSYATPPSAGTKSRSMPVQNALSPVADSTTERTESSVRSDRHSPDTSSHITLLKAW
ncbi:MAG: hypothetical protein R2746_10515 [Acidimicrobiales bacterium]